MHRAHVSRRQFLQEASAGTVADYPHRDYAARVAFLERRR